MRIELGFIVGFLMAIVLNIFYDSNEDALADMKRLAENGGGA